MTQVRIVNDGWTPARGTAVAARRRRFAFPIHAHNNRALRPSGLALAGSFTSTSLLLTVNSVVATVGFDGITMATSMFLSLGLLLLLARPIRLSGACTLGDLFVLRASGTAPRMAAAVATLLVTGPFLIVQLMAAGSVTAALLGFTGVGIQKVCTVLIGGLVVTCGVLSGAKGLTSVQTLATTVVGAAMLVVCVCTIRAFHGDIDALIGDGSTTRLGFAGGQLSLVLGGACMPHVLNRVYAMRDTATARRSIRYATGVVAFLCAAVVLLGFGAAARIGAREITGGQGNGDDALMLLARDLAEGKWRTDSAACFSPRSPAPCSCAFWRSSAAPRRRRPAHSPATPTGTAHDANSRAARAS